RLSGREICSRGSQRGGGATRSDPHRLPRRRLSSPESYVEQVQRLQTEFRLYDRNVDVVSAWELIFTQSDTAIPPRVRHFERFPSIAIAGGRELTLDFTAVFKEGPGVVAEVG